MKKEELEIKKKVSIVPIRTARAILITTNSTTKSRNKLPTPKYQ